MQISCQLIKPHLLFFLFHFIIAIIIINMFSPDADIEQLLTSIDHNEESVLNALKIFIDMLQNLSQLSIIIYTPDGNFPI